MPSDQKIDYIELPANDFDSIESFYRHTFGWTFTDYGPEYCYFSDGKLHVVRSASEFATRPVSIKRPARERLNDEELYLQVSSARSSQFDGTSRTTALFG